MTIPILGRRTRLLYQPGLVTARVAPPGQSKRGGGHGKGKGLDLVPGSGGVGGGLVGPSLVAVGAYTGNGVDGRLIVVGLAPDVVLVRGAGATNAVWRTSTMVGDNSKENSNSVLQADKIQSLTGSGFTVGTDPQVNTDGTAYYYLALKEAASFLKVLTYTGNGLDNRNLAGAGFQPDLVIVLPSSASFPQWTTVEQQNPTADRSQAFTASSPAANKIQALQSDGFQVGTDSSVNADTVAYHAICLKKVNEAFDIVEYTGNGADDRNLDVLSHRPDFMLVQQQGPANGPVVRFQDQVGDVSLELTNVAAAANKIQAFRPAGFQVGTHAGVNSNTVVYTALALRER